MDIKKLIEQYLPSAKVMQLATAANNKPWVCTVHFDFDKSLNLYWVSDTHCRHSQEIVNNPQASAAIAVKTDWPVVGLQFEGEARMVQDQYNIERVVKSFAKRHNRDDSFVADMMAGTSPKKVYVLEVDHIQLFDPKDFAGAPKQTWRR